jgi:hypothetical protein
LSLKYCCCGPITLETQQSTTSVSQRDAPCHSTQSAKLTCQAGRFASSLCTRQP